MEVQPQKKLLDCAYGDRRQNCVIMTLHALQKTLEDPASRLSTQINPREDEYTSYSGLIEAT